MIKNFPRTISDISAPAFLAKAWRGRRRPTVGVVISERDIQLVKITASGTAPVLSDWRAIDIETAVRQDREKFTDFLQSALNRFCGRSGEFDIWADISSPAVEVRLLRIPKVPRRRIATTVFWSFKKEVPFVDKDQIFDFEIQGETLENDVKKIEVLAYIAPAAEVREQKQLFADAGFPLTGITIFPFGLQNYFRLKKLDTGGENICSLFIGQTWSRIDIFNSGGALALSRGIKAGINSMAEAIRTEINEKRAAAGTEENQGEHILLLEDSADQEVADEIDTDQAQDLLFHIGCGQTAGETPPGVDIDKNALFQIITPAVERIIRQVDRTLEHFSLKFGGLRANRIYISGKISGYEELDRYIGEQLGISTHVIDPFDSLESLKDRPKAISERLSFAHGTGIALSDQSITPNFLYTYKDAENFRKSRQLNQAIGLIFLVLLLLMGGYKIWQNQLIEQKANRVTQLEARLDEFDTRVNQPMLLKLAAEIKNSQQVLNRAARQYGPMAVLTEICSTTPENVRLIQLSLDLPEQFGAPANNPDPSSKRANAPQLMVKGIIRAPSRLLEAELADYLRLLKKSAFFDRPVIKEKRTHLFMDAEVLSFTAFLNIR